MSGAVRLHYLLTLSRNAAFPDLAARSADISMLRSARPLLARMATVRHATTRLSPEAMDAAIAEMNQEMESLFGTPSADQRVGPPTLPVAEPAPSVHRLHAPEAEPPAPTVPRTPALSMSSGSSQIDISCNQARAALCGKMDTLAAQLAAADDAEQSGKLAKGVAACASALREVVELHRVAAARPPPEAVA